MIVNAILNEHQIVVDIVAFVNKGNFPRSRLGEKQRGTILAKWVKRTLQTEAQFAIRNSDFTPMDGSGSPGPDGMEQLRRTSLGSMRSGSGAPARASSLRNVEPAPQILEQAEVDQRQYGYDDRFSMQAPSSSSGYAMSGPTQDSRFGNQSIEGQHSGANVGFASYAQPAPGTAYSPQPQVYERAPAGPQHNSPRQPAIPQLQPVEMPASTAETLQSDKRQSNAPQIRLPGVDGRESLDLWRPQETKDEDDWTADAIMHMNLAGDLGRQLN